MKAAKNAKEGAELAIEEAAKISANDADADTASVHALDAKVFAAQAIFESEISATAAKEVKGELANEKTKLKEDISAKEKIEGEKKEEKLGSIQKEVEEAAEKTKKAADDAAAKLKEAFKAQYIAELFLPVANTDAAREAAKIVKNAVTNATAGVTKVRRARSL